MKRPRAKVAWVKGYTYHKDGKVVHVKGHKTHVRLHHKSPKYRRVVI